MKAFTFSPYPVFALGVVLTAVGAGIWLTGSGGLTEAPGAALQPLSPTRMRSLGLTVEVQVQQQRSGDAWSHRLMTVDENGPSDPAPLRLSAGDRLRLSTLR